MTPPPPPRSLPYYSPDSNRLIGPCELTLCSDFSFSVISHLCSDFMCALNVFSLLYSYCVFRLCLPLMCSAINCLFVFRLCLALLCLAICTRFMYLLSVFSHLPSVNVFDQALPSHLNLQSPRQSRSCIQSYRVVSYPPKDVYNDVAHHTKLRIRTVVLSRLSGWAHWVGMT